MQSLKRVLWPGERGTSKKVFCWDLDFSWACVDTGRVGALPWQGAGKWRKQMCCHGNAGSSRHWHKTPFLPLFSHAENQSGLSASGALEGPRPPTARRAPLTLGEVVGRGGCSPYTNGQTVALGSHCHPPAPDLPLGHLQLSLKKKKKACIYLNFLSFQLCSSDSH